MTCAAQLELFVRIQRLAPSDVLDTVCKLRFKLAKNLTLWRVKGFPWFNFIVNFEWRV